MLRWQTGVCACSRASPLCPQNITNVVIDMSLFCSASSNSQLTLLAQWWPSARGSIAPGESNVRSASGNPYWNIGVHDVLTRRSHICAAGVSVAEGEVAARGASCLGRISELASTYAANAHRHGGVRTLHSFCAEAYLDQSGRTRAVRVGTGTCENGIHARNGPKPAGSAVHSVSSGASRCSQYYLRRVSQWQMVMMISSIVMCHSWSSHSPWPS